jgi:hypothetical protein
LDRIRPVATLFTGAVSELAERLTDFVLWDRGDPGRQLVEADRPLKIHKGDRILTDCSQ